MPAKPDSASGKTGSKPGSDGAGGASAASTEPVAPPDLGPNIDPNLPAVMEAWKLLDPEGMTFISLLNTRTFFGALRIYPSDAEWDEIFVPDLGGAGESLFVVCVCVCVCVICVMLVERSALPYRFFLPLHSRFPCSVCVSRVMKKLYLITDSPQGHEASNLTSKGLMGSLTRSRKQTKSLLAQRSAIG